LLLSAEDSPEDTIHPRLVAAGADLARVHIVREVRGQDGRPRLFELPTDIEALEALIVQHQAVLVVIDPLTAFLSPAIDGYRDQDVRLCLGPLAAVAERTGAAILIVRHLNKSQGRAALQRGGGSIGVIAAVRTAFVIAPAVDDKSVRVLAMVKSNLGPFPPALKFTLAPTAHGVARVEWLGTTDASADDLVGDGSEGTIIGEAVEFLRDRLSLGPVQKTVLVKEAKDHGISPASLQRAKVKIGAKSRKAGFNSPWEWWLPGVTSPPVLIY
jgi:hypothetical protein